MATDFEQRRNGLLLGSFVADALSLGVHWIYDTDELSRKFGYVTGYHAPGADSYHPHKQAGDQSHVGDQALLLNDFLIRNQRWDANAFMQNWAAMWPDYNDYVDHATKSTLANLESGKTLIDAASNSNELAGPARSAPLIAFLAKESETHVTQSVIEQTVLTHHSEATIEAAEFFAKACYRLLHGSELEATLRETAPTWALEKADSVLALETLEATEKLGLSCPIPSALPAVLYLALKHGEEMPKAFSENAMAGGDNCARALGLGMLLGAAHGISAIPVEWSQQLNAPIETHLFT